MTLTKADLVDQVHAFNSKMTKAKASEAVETFLRIIKSSLESSEDVLPSGFGKFSVKEKAARKGRNPKTGESVYVTPKKVPFFKCGKELKDRVDY